MSRWIDFVKEFAKKKNITYGCALSMPECSQQYRKKYGVNKKPTKKEEKERKKRERMERERKEREEKIEFNKNADMLKKPLEEERDAIYNKIAKDILGEFRYNKDARRMFNDIIRRATPYSEDGKIWWIDRERVRVPKGFVRYRELSDEINKIPYYNIY